MGHRAAMFSGRGAKARAVALSVLACLALAVFILPSTSDVSIAAVYSQAAAKASGSTVAGTFTSNGKTPLKGQRVTLVFKDKRGHVIRRQTVVLNRKGEFKVTAPRGSKKVTVQATRRGVKVHGTFNIKPGKDLSVTAVVPPKHGSLLPGIFPY